MVGDRGLRFVLKRNYLMDFWVDSTMPTEAFRGRSLFSAVYFKADLAGGD